MQEEDEESDRSSSGLEESVEEDEEDESEDSDDGSESLCSRKLTVDLRQYDPRTIAPSRRADPQLPKAGASRPRLVGSGETPQPRQDTFGSRLHSSRPKLKASNPADDDGVLSMRRSMDGGMEMSFIPQAKGRFGGDEERDVEGDKRRRDRKVEKFGAGLEKGMEDEVDLGKGGRVRRRQVGMGRSASKNAFRKR